MQNNPNLKGPSPIINEVGKTKHNPTNQGLRVEEHAMGLWVEDVGAYALNVHGVILR